MCLEHKQYWQCCLTIDSAYLDPCPDAGQGLKCQIKQRVHPIGGYCQACRLLRNKVEDDVVSNPRYSHNDNYQRPWESGSEALVPWKGERSHSVAPSIQTERGRRSRRLDEPSAPSSRNNYSYYYTERARTPSLPPSESEPSDDELYVRRRRRHHRNHHTRDGHAGHKARHTEKPSAPFDPAVEYRVASPRTTHRLQRAGVIAPEKCRVISTPTELRRAQKQGLVPSTEVLQQLQMQYRSKR